MELPELFVLDSNTLTLFELQWGQRIFSLPLSLKYTHLLLEEKVVFLLPAFCCQVSRFLA